MRWGAEFWMRVGIALFFFGLVVAAPMILFPFTVSAGARDPFESAGEIHP